MLFQRGGARERGATERVLTSEQDEQILAGNRVLAAFVPRAWQRASPLCMRRDNVARSKCGFEAAGGTGNRNGRAKDERKSDWKDQYGSDKAVGPQGVAGTRTRPIDSAGIIGSGS